MGNLLSSTSRLALGRASRRPSSWRPGLWPTSMTEGTGSATDRPFALSVERVRVGGLPVPDALVGWVVRNFDPTPKIASRVPFPVQIGRVSVRDQALRITTAEGSR